MAGPSGDRRVNSIYRELSKQRRQLLRQGGNVPKASNPSVINRVFDVLSRGNYAVAEPYRRVVKRMGENEQAGRKGDVSELPGLLAGGFWGGLSGKNKSTFADVFKEGDKLKSQPGFAKNRIFQGVAGLGLDIGMDPLTYVGASVVKPVTALERGTKTAKAIGAAQKAAGRKTSMAGVQTALRAGEAAAVPERAGKLGLTFAGRDVAPNLALPNMQMLGRFGGRNVGELAYSGAAKTLRPVGQTGLVSGLHGSLSNKAIYKGPMNAMRRRIEQQGVAAYHDKARHIMQEYGKLTKAEGEEIGRAIESGTMLTGLSAKGVDRGKAQRAMMGWIQDAENVEKRAGITRLIHGQPNYLPKQFTPEEYPKWLELKKSMPKDHVFTTAELKQAGLHPYENVLDAVRLRLVEAHRAASRSFFKRDLIDEVGFVAEGRGAQAAGKAAKAEGLKKVHADNLYRTDHAGKEVYLPEQAKQALEHFDELYKNPKDLQSLLRIFDTAQRGWKTAVTTLNPAHHLRNIVGDTFLSWEAGVRDPRAITRSLSMLREQGKMQVGKSTFDMSELHRLYKETGGASGFYSTELVGRRGMGMQEWLRDKVSLREDFMRGATWTDALREYSKTKPVNNLDDLRKAAEYASEKVNKFHFDYGDLTRTETWIRRAIPFYTFMRKNMPLQMEMLAMHPGQMSKVPKAFTAIQNMMGADSEHMPIDALIPSYLRNLAAIPVVSSAGGRNPVFMDPQLPLVSAVQPVTGSWQEALRRNMGQTVAGPLAELGFGRSNLTGQPINNDLVPWLLNQTPATRLAQGALNPPRPNRVIQPGEDFGNQWLKAFSSIFSPVGLKEITPQSMASELRRQQDPIEARLRKLRIERQNRRRR